VSDTAPTADNTPAPLVAKFFTAPNALLFNTVLPNSLPLVIVLETILLPFFSKSLPLERWPLRRFLPFDTKSFPLETVLENKLLPLDRRSFPCDFKKLAPLDIVFLSAVPPLENKFWFFPKKSFPLADKYIKLLLDFTSSFPIDVIVTVLCFILYKVSLPLSRILNKVVC